VACRSGSCQHRLSDVEEPVSDRREFTVHSRAGLGAAQGHVLDVENSARQQIQFVDHSVILCRCIVITKAVHRVPFIWKGSVLKQLEKNSEGTKIHVEMAVIMELVASLLLLLATFHWKSVCG